MVGTSSKHIQKNGDIHTYINSIYIPLLVTKTPKTTNPAFMQTYIPKVILLKQTKKTSFVFVDRKSVV